MNVLQRIRVMLSSRSQSNAFSPPIKLESVRQNLQALLHRLRWLQADANAPRAGFADQPIFDAWIHENERAKSGARNTFELSLTEIRRADIIIVLYTGEAGSAGDDREVGICHAELQEAMARRGDVVHIVELLPLVASNAVAESALHRDQSFQNYVNGLGAFRVQVSDEAQLQAAVVALLQQAVAQLVKRGASSGRRRDRGQPLDWGRLDLGRRRFALLDALAAELGLKTAPTANEAVQAAKSGRKVAPAPHENAMQIQLAGRWLCARIDAIPDALSVPAARELVGQPFHRDHEIIDAANDAAPGIVHLIACHRGVTETQAKKMLGTSDSMAIASDFGVYAADHVQQIQIFFFAQCVDEGAVAIAVRRLNEWLAQTNEIDRVVARAAGRLRILRAVREALEATHLPSNLALETLAGKKRRTP